MMALSQMKEELPYAVIPCASAASSSRSSSAVRVGVRDRNSSVCPEEPHILRRKRANVSSEKCSNVPLKIILGIPRRSSIGKGVPLTANFICHGKECPVKTRLATHTPIDHARSLISV